MSFMEMDGFKEAVESSAPIESIGSVLSSGFNTLTNAETAPSISPDASINLAVNTPSNSTPGRLIHTAVPQGSGYSLQNKKF